MAFHAGQLAWMTWRLSLIAQYICILYSHLGWGLPVLVLRQRPGADAVRGGVLPRFTFHLRLISDPFS